MEEACAKRFLGHCVRFRSQAHQQRLEEVGVECLREEDRCQTLRKMVKFNEICDYDLFKKKNVAIREAQM